MSVLVVQTRAPARLRAGAIVAATSLAYTLSACDPGAGVRVRTNLIPGPAPACIDSALARSMVVQRVEPHPLSGRQRGGERRYFVFFAPADSTRHQSDVTFRPTSDSAAALTVTFLWLGRLGFVADSTRHWMAERGTALVNDVRTACAPRSPEPTQCEEFETMGNRRSACDSTRAERP